ncbi:MAG: hypothetical protein GX891_04690 [Clostridiales bacterium]|nr:hypothetical protein [Clostridiales bacterium]
MKSGCILGVVGGKIFGVLFKAIDIAITVVAKFIVYFGLYIPLLYLIYGGVLWLTLDFNPFGGGVNTNLYLFGLGLSFVCSVIIAVRNLIIKPFKRHFVDSKIVEYTGKRLSRSAPEPPKIYKSKMNPGIVVYEYENRYDLYEETPDGLIPLGTEMKKKKKLDL